MSDKPYDNTEYMGCACHSPEHIMQLMLWNEEPKMLCLYICLKPEDATRLIEMLNKIKE